MAAPASSSGVSRSWPVAIAWAQPSSAKQADDAVGAAEQVLGHLAGGEHAAGGPQEPELVLDPGQVLQERGDPGGRGVVERVQVGQVEPPVGLAGCRVAIARRRWRSRRRRRGGAAATPSQ
jgi:hypothetical protein